MNRAGVLFLVLVLSMASFHPDFGMAADVSKLESKPTLVFKVKGIVCAMCVQGIRRRVGTLPQVQSVAIDLKQGRVTVQAREGELLSPENVALEIEKSGYELSDDSELLRMKNQK
jgi:cation transport ATPase